MSTLEYLSARLTLLQDAESEASSGDRDQRSSRNPAPMSSQFRVLPCSLSFRLGRSGRDKGPHSAGQRHEPDEISMYLEV